MTAVSRGAALALVLGGCAASKSAPPPVVAPTVPASGSSVPVATAPPPAPAVPPHGLQDRATACLDAPSCAAAEADRLFRVADDAAEDDVDCLRFADGDGTAKDLARARACLERSVRGQACDGSSAGLLQAELATYLIDGVGGPPDVARARAVFEGCFDDVTKQEVFEHAAAREANPGARPVDFCTDYGGTTLTSNECGARTRQHHETLAALEAKRVFATLGDDARTLFVAASRAYAAYVEAMGAYVYQVYIDGTIRNAASLAEETALVARRASEMARFAAFAPARVSVTDAARAAKKVDTAFKSMTSGAETPEVTSKIAEAQRAWTAYADADVSFYVKAFASRAPEAAIERQVRLTLDQARLADLTPPSEGK